MTRLLRSSNFWLLNRALLVVISLAFAGTAFAQAQKRANVAPEEQPVFNEYRGVKIGWLADDVRKKLGNPLAKGDEQDYYEFGEKEKAQVYYDKATRQVTAISVDFMNGASEVITPQQVFGADIEAKPDGSKSKLV